MSEHTSVATGTDADATDTATKESTTSGSTRTKFNGTEPDADSDETSEPTTRQPVTTGAEAVVRALENAGVEYAFGVQGGAIMPVYDALYDSDIRHVTMAHEQGASHAADAYGIVAGEPGVCLATSGPGATNIVTGLADANLDSDPMIALTGQVPTAFVGNDAFQETDTTGVTAPVTKTNTFSSDPDRVGTDVSEAFALAREGRPGPTLVDLPKDVTLSETETEPDEPRTPDTYEVQLRADPDVVEAAARRIEESHRPVLLLGGGVIKGDASEVCREFAYEHEIPVVTTMPGLGSFPEDHELSMGMAGMHGTGYANLALTLCDTLIGIGTRFDDRLTGGIETFAPDAELIHVDIDPAEISKNIHAEYPLVGDAATAVSQLTEEVETSPGITKWRAQCQQWKSEYPMAYETPEDAPVQPQFVVEALDEATSDRAIVTTGVGQHQMWACQYWTYTEPRTWVSSHGLGTMGYGLPAAIGARLAAADDQEVISVEGDASFLMTLQELAVAVRENLDITVVVLNNEYIGMVRQWQDAFFEGRHAASEYGWCPEFDKLAEAFGARGFRIDEYDDVAETIEAALAYDGPSVIDAHVDPQTNVYPMVPSGGDNGQFALSEDQL